MAESVLIVGSYGTSLLHVDGKGEGIVACKRGEKNFTKASLLSWRENKSFPRNPSYVAVHPSQPVVYCVDEHLNSGRIFAFQVDESSLAFNLVSTVDSLGTSAAHLAVDPSGSFLFATNYGGGPTLSFNLHKETGHIEGLISVIDSSQVGSFKSFPGPNVARQEKSHPHQCFFTGSLGEGSEWNGNHLLVPDLGLDCVHVLLVTNEGILSPKGYLNMSPGSGPRHLAQHPEEPHFVFVLCELSSTLIQVDLRCAQVFSYLDAKAAEEGRRGIVCTISTVDGIVDKATSDSVSTAAAIAIHPSGRYIYCSNRVTAGNGTIALFWFNSRPSSLSFQRCFDSLGLIPREIKLDDKGEILFVCNQDSHTIIMFNVNQQDGYLTPNFTLSLFSPVSLAILCTQALHQQNCLDLED